VSGSGKTKERQDLTARTIKSLKPEAAPYRVPDARVPSLALRVAPDGGKTWDLSYRIKGEGVRRPSLGRYGDVSLEAARARALALTSAARQGVDLIAQERRAREDKAKAITVGALAELYLARRIRRLRSALEIERTLKRVLAPLASAPAADVRKRDLVPLFESIAATGHERAAGKARQMVGALFKYAESVGVVSANPTRGLLTYDQGSPRDRVLDEGEIRLLWAWLESSTLSFAMADALRVQLLIGARIGEVGGILPDEIDRNTWLWRLPAERSKNKHSRVTPLVGCAREIVAARIEGADGGPLFPAVTGLPLSSGAIATALYNRRERLPIAAFGTHDLRRTVATMMEEMGIAENIIGAIVGHGVEDGKQSVRTLRRHYLKSDLIERKTRALEAWDARLKAIIAHAAQDNVVQLHGAQRSGG
jgi:integrase